MSWFTRRLAARKWEEAQHPRANDGKFTDGSGGDAKDKAVATIAAAQHAPKLVDPHANGGLGPNVMYDKAGKRRSPEDEKAQRSGRRPPPKVINGVKFYPAWNREGRLTWVTIPD